MADIDINAVIEHFNNLSFEESCLLLDKSIKEKLVMQPFASSSYTFGILVGAVYALSHLSKNIV